MFKIIEKGMGVVAASIDSAVSRYDTLNRFSPIMQQMGFSAEDTSTSIKKLSDGIQGLPTSLDQIVGSTQRIASMTGDLTGAADITLALNNAFLASGSSSDAAARGMEQYMQIIGRGKPEMEDWKTLQETMPYALQQVAESFGYAGTSATRNFYAALQSGEITVEQMNASFVKLSTATGGFAEIAMTATGGIGTAFTNMNTRIAAGVAEVVASIDSGLSQTRFKSIENIISNTGTVIKSVLVSVAPVAAALAANLDSLAVAAVGVGTAFAAYKAIGAWNAAAKEAAKVSEFLKETNQQLTLATGKSTATQLEQVAATKLQEAQDASARYEKLELIATEKKNTAETLKAAAAKATGTNATRLQSEAASAATVAEQAQTAAKAAGTAANAASTASVHAEVAAQNARNTSVGLGTALIGYLTGSLTLHQLATAAATVATTLFKMALNALPLVGIAVAIGVVVAGVIALVKWFAAGSEAYQEQKEEVEALTAAQEELATSTEESSDTYKSNAAEIAATNKVSKSFVSVLKEVSASTANADEKHRKMAATVNQLNATMDDLNIAYDEETGAIHNVNTGQEISIDQLEQLVSAKAELAQANAWQERANELVREQVKIQEDLAVIEAKKQDIMANSNLNTREQEKLIKELDQAAAGHATTMEDVELRLAVVNDNLATANTTMAESVVADYERVGQALTENGENIDDVATRWGVSVESIKAAWTDAGGSFDEFVTAQDEAMGEYAEAVQSHTESVVNSFKEIPAEYEMSAEKMIETLRTNRERYAEWKQAMVEISGQVSAETLAELDKLGPGALSAINQMRENGGAGLREFDAEIRSIMSESTGYVTQSLNDPGFIGAPAGAFEASAQQLAGNTTLPLAATGVMENTKAAAGAVDFAEVGQNIAADIVGGLKGADVTGAMNSITAAIQGSTGKVTSAATSMSTSVQNVFKTMSTQSQNTVTQMMTAINSTIVSRTGTIRASITGMGNSITTALNTNKTQAVNITTQMMTSINSAIVSRASTVKASMTSCANGVITALTDMKTKSGTLAEQTMTGINSAIVSRTGTIKGSAAAVSKGIVDSLQPMIKGAAAVAGSMMDGIGTAMDNKAGSLYKKAREIARRIAATMEDALDVHSPSRVMIRLFENVMMGIYEGMDGMSGMLYREAENIAGGLAERLTISPDVANTLAEQLRGITEANPLGGVTLTPQSAYAGAGGGTSYVTSLTQHITTPKPLSPSEMTREGQDLLRRSRWQLP